MLKKQNKTPEHQLVIELDASQGRVYLQGRIRPEQAGKLAERLHRNLCRRMVQHKLHICQPEEPGSEYR